MDVEEVRRRVEEARRSIEGEGLDRWGYLNYTKSVIYRDTLRAALAHLDQGEHEQARELMAAALEAER